MRVGIISDIHGNTHALHATLDELAKLRVDRIICLGDAINPLPGSEAVLEKLESLHIPILLGNHEDYVIRCFERPHDPVNLAPNFGPVRALAKRLSKDLIERLNGFPTTLTLDDPEAGQCLLVHASPQNNRIGYRYGIDADMSDQLMATNAAAIVCGHWHDPETRDWNGIRLINNGSVGVPLRGRVEAEFLVLEPRGDEWRAEHCSVPYDNEATLKDYRESGLIEEGGPASWLFYDEIRTGEKRLSAYFKWANTRGRSYATPESLETSAREYLQEVGSWPSLSTFI